RLGQDARMPGPPHWRRVSEIFHGALALPPERRAAYVASACGTDDALREEVERLLASDRQAKSFLQSPAFVTDEPEPSRQLEGQRIGPYDLVALIGEGGMGRVYKARDTRLHRTVAIKVLP